jgi:chromosome partitioning protein
MYIVMFGMRIDIHHTLMREQNMVFTVENRKGGCGKTTTAVTIAVELAARVRENSQDRVLLIDLDPQGDAARALGIEAGNRCVSRILDGSGSFKDNVVSASINGLVDRGELYVLPASDRLSDVKARLIGEPATKYAAEIAARAVLAGFSGQEGKVQSFVVDPGAARREAINLFQERLAPLKKLFRYIVLDCPPTLDIFQQAVHEFADYAVVPVKLEYLSTSATGRHTDNILADQAEGIKIRITAVVPTFVDPRLTIVRETYAELLQKYGRAVCKPIPRTTRIEQATQDGLTITEADPESRAAQAYSYLVDKLMEKKT